MVDVASLSREMFFGEVLLRIYVHSELCLAVVNNLKQNHKIIPADCKHIFLWLISSPVEKITNISIVNYSHGNRESGLISNEDSAFFNGPMMKDPVRNDRQPSGFYRCGKVQPLRRASVLQIGPKFTLQWKVTLVPMEDEEPLIIRRIEGRIISATGKHRLAGYLDWYLFEAAPFRVVGRFSFVDACDAHSQELCGLAEQLIRNRRFSIERLLAMGPVAFMNLLEMRPPFAGQGLGVQATKALAAKLHDDITLHVAFMVPVPLQYQPACDNDDRAEIDELSFRRDRAKLIRYYKRVFGLSEVRRGGGYWAWNIDDWISNYGGLPE